MPLFRVRNVFHAMPRGTCLLMIHFSGVPIVLATISGSIAIGMTSVLVVATMDTGESLMTITAASFAVSRMGEG